MFKWFKMKEKVEHVEKYEPTKLYQRLSTLYNTIYAIFLRDERTPVYIGPSSTRLKIDVNTELGKRTFHVGISRYDINPSYSITMFNGKEQIFSISASVKDTTVFPQMTMKLDSKAINLAIYEFEQIINNEYKDIKAKLDFHKNEVKKLENCEV